jgi:hypothetical protein
MATGFAAWTNQFGSSFISELKVTPLAQIASAF